MSQTHGQTDVLTRFRESEVRKPSKWKVILLNDDITTMDFVVSILQEIFEKSSEEAIKIMFDIHEKGSGIAGIYCCKDLAETKQELTLSRARAEGFPLKVVTEKE